MRAFFHGGRMAHPPPPGRRDQPWDDARQRALHKHGACDKGPSFNWMSLPVVRPDSILVFRTIEFFADVVREGLAHVCLAIFVPLVLECADATGRGPVAREGVKHLHLAVAVLRLCESASA